MTDHSDLKDWVQWAKKQPNMADEQPLFIKAIEDAISQAGMVPQLRAQLAEAQKEIARLNVWASDSHVTELEEKLTQAQKAIAEKENHYEVQVGLAVKYRDQLVETRSKLDSALNVLRTLGYSVDCLKSNEQPSPDTTPRSSYRETLEILTELIERDCYECWTDVVRSASDARELLDGTQFEKSSDTNKGARCPGQGVPCCPDEGGCFCRYCGGLIAEKESKP
jgi:hypothetical protein